MRNHAASMEQVYEHVLLYVSRHGYGPTYRELADATGLTLSYVHRLVGELRDEGALVAAEARAGRTIYPTHREEHDKDSGVAKG